LLFYCKNTTVEAAYGTIIVNITESQEKYFTPKTLVPAIDMTPAVYDISGNGPDGSSFLVSSGEMVTEIGSLLLGEWQITAEAKNAFGDSIGQGSSNATVTSTESVTVNIDVNPLSGTGILNLEVHWKQEDISNPSIEAELITGSKDSIPLNFTIDVSGSGICTQTNIFSGYYTITIKLLDDTTLKIGAVEVVRIVKDQTTFGIFDFTDLSTAIGNINVYITPQMNNSITVNIAGQFNEITLGTSMKLEALTFGESDVSTFVWYLNGESKGTGSFFTTNSSLLEGVYRLDATAFNVEGTRGGSYTHNFKVLPYVTLGSLTYSMSLIDGENGFDFLSGVRGVDVSNDNKNVYITSYNDDSLLVFTRNPLSGSLYFIQVVKNNSNGVIGLDGADGVTVTPDGKSVYVAGYADDSLAVFSRDLSTGEVLFFQDFKNGKDGINCLDGASRIAVSSDGGSVYITGFKDNSVAVFTRDTITGELTYLNGIKNGSNGLEDFIGPKGITVSLDGKNVYVACYSSDSLAVFNRNTTTGEILFSALFKNGESSVEGLNGASNVIVSSDGKNVYVSSYYDSSLVIFNRNISTGELSYNTFVKDGVNGIDGLGSARTVIESPDSHNIYVAGGTDDSIAIFSRNIENGELSFKTFLQNGTDGVKGLDGVRGLAISHDGKNIYAAASTDNAVSIFNRFAD